MIRFRSGALLLASTILAACGPSSDSSGGREFGGTLIIATSGEAKHLLPPFVYETTGKAVSDMLFELAAQEGAAMVLVTHDQALAARADRWVDLRAGQAAEAA